MICEGRGNYTTIYHVHVVEKTTIREIYQLKVRWGSYSRTGKLVNDGEVLTCDAVAFRGKGISRLRNCYCCMFVCFEIVQFCDGITPKECYAWLNGSELVGLKWWRVETKFSGYPESHCHGNVLFQVSWLFQNAWSEMAEGVACGFMYFIIGTKLTMVKQTQIEIPNSVIATNSYSTERHLSL